MKKNQPLSASAIVDGKTAVELHQNDPQWVELVSLADRFDCHVSRLIDSPLTSGPRVMLQMAYETDSYLSLWSAGWHPSKEAAVARTIEHFKDCIAMNIFQTGLFQYLEGLMLKDRDLNLTIKAVTMQKILEPGTNKKIDKPCLHFHETDKALILNKTQAKMIIMWFGPDTNDWLGHTLTFYAEPGNWGGKPSFGVRIREKLPQQKTGPRNGNGGENSKKTTNKKEGEK